MTGTSYDAIGVVEVSFYSNAVYLLDVMEKAAEIEFLTAEKLLGGRLVTLIVGGTTSEVDAAVHAANLAGENMVNNPVKVAITISNPNSEIMKYVIGGFNHEAMEKQKEKNDNVKK